MSGKTAGNSNFSVSCDSILEVFGEFGPRRRCLKSFPLSVNKKCQEDKLVVVVANYKSIRRFPAISIRSCLAWSFLFPYLEFYRLGLSFSQQCLLFMKSGKF